MQNYLTEWGFLGFAGSPPNSAGWIDNSFQTATLKRIRYEFSVGMLPAYQADYVSSAQTFPCDSRLVQHLAIADQYLSWSIYWKWLDEALKLRARESAEWDESSLPPSYRRPSKEYPPDWSERKRAVRKRDRNRCCACGTRIGMDEEVGTVHHITHKHLAGHNLTNLVCMCDDCHDAMPEHEIRHARSLVVADDHNRLIHMSNCRWAHQAGMRQLEDDWPKEYGRCVECQPQRNAKFERSRRYQQAVAARFPVIREYLTKLKASWPPSQTLCREALEIVPKVDVFRIMSSANLDNFGLQEVEVMQSDGSWATFAYPTPGSSRDGANYDPKPYNLAGVKGMTPFVFGVIKHFDPQKGFGFIQVTDDEDVFFHCQQVTNLEDNVLGPGVRMLFDRQVKDGKTSATNIKILPAREQD